MCACVRVCVVGGQFGSSCRVSAGPLLFTESCAWEMPVAKKRPAAQSCAREMPVTNKRPAAQHADKFDLALTNVEKALRSIGLQDITVRDRAIGAR